AVVERDFRVAAAFCDKHGPVPAAGTSAQPVPAGLQRRRKLAPFARRERLLEHHVRRHLRPADAEVDSLDRADGRIRSEAELDGVLEVDAEVVVAALAVDPALE